MHIFLETNIVGGRNVCSPSDDLVCFRIGFCVDGEVCVSLAGMERSTPLALPRTFGDLSILPLRSALMRKNVLPRINERGNLLPHQQLGKCSS